MDLNEVTLLGRLGRDPEIRHLNNGDPVANMSVATSEKWRNKNSGDMEERTEWSRVVAFGHAAEFAQKYLAKGSRVLVRGKLQTRKWTDNSGVEKYTTEIVINNFGGKLISVESRNSGGDAGGGGDYTAEQYRQQSGSSRSAGQGGHQQQQPGGGTDPDLDDEIPF